ncbi:MAG: SDR family oxidoreductase [Chloroflexi bacterium]|nr:MAG: SDR family oxidoreductase [Chloroflexota bacterium]
MRVFVTGATGFAGSHLIDALLAEQHEIFALVHSASSPRSLPTHPRLHAVQGDLLDLPGLRKVVQEVQPEVIYHLAGQASPALSWRNPAQTLSVNTIGTVHVLEAAVAIGRPRVVVVTSADIYGHLQEADLPLTELSLPHPRHPYGVSKYAAGQLVSVYWQRYKLPVVEARPFNHIGPRQTLGFVVPDFASQLAAIKLGARPPVISVGNLDAQRDFTDVRDVVRAYQLLAEKGKPGEAYLICSGKPTAVATILETLIDLVGIEVTVQRDENRMRPAEVPCVYGSYAKLAQDTNWKPQISLRQTLSDVLDEWLAL